MAAKSPHLHQESEAFIHIITLLYNYTIIFKKKKEKKESYSK